MLIKSIQLRMVALLLAVVTLTHCAYVDDNLIDGKAARRIIAERVQLHIIIYGTVGFFPFAALFYLTPDIIITDEKATYNRTDVERCADQVFVLGFLGPPLLTPFLCNIGPEPIQIPVFTQKL